MKSFIHFLIVTLLFSIFPFQLEAQNEHHHDAFEELMQNKTIKRYLKDLKLTTEQQTKQYITDFAEEEFHQLFSSIQNRYFKTGKIDLRQVEEEYQLLLRKTKEKITSLKEPRSDKNKGTSGKAINGPCVNMDFEEGTLNGWTLTKGQIDGSTQYSYTMETPALPGPHHQIMGNGTDPVTGIPTNNPATGNFSVRLGNGTGTGAEGARMSQTFMVDSSNYLFSYSYAVIFQSPLDHTAEELPYFTVRVFDIYGNSVQCGEYSVVANQATASDYQSINVGSNTVLFKNWTSVLTNLSSYIGQNMRIEFTAGDCSLSGHYGYCYIDAQCGLTDIISDKDVICLGDSAVLSAPVGASTYQWSTGQTTQSIVVYNGGTYQCQLTALQAQGCDVSLSITLTDQPKPVPNFNASTPTLCSLDSVYFNSISTVPSPWTLDSYQWKFGDGIQTIPDTGNISNTAQTTGDYISPAHQYLSAGNPVVKLIVRADQCSDSISLPLTVFANPIVNSTPDHNLCEGQSTSLSASGALNYSWDQGIQNGISFTPNVGSQLYTVIGTDANGCTDSAQSLVQVFAYPLLEAGPNQQLCFGDTTVLSASLSSNYQWSNGQQDGVPFQPPLGTSTYVVFVNQNNCITFDSLLITVSPQTIIDAGQDQLICSDDFAQLSASMSNGQSPLWFGGNGVFSSPNTLNTSYTASPSEINKGNVTLYFQAQSPFSCPTQTDSVQIVLNHFASSSQLTKTDITCNGYDNGTANLAFVSANNGPFQFILDGGNPSNSPNFSNLNYGTHNIVILNSIGCDTTVSFFINQPAPLNISLIEFRNIDCFGNNNGLISTSISGGISPYTHWWSNNPLNNTPSNQNLAPGYYQLIIYDKNGCQTSFDTTVTQPEMLVNQFIYNPIPCFGDSTFLQALVSGGTQPIQHLWGNNLSSPSIIAYAGEHSVQIQDANNCSIKDSVLLIEPEVLTMDMSNDTTVCSNSWIQVKAWGSGGTAPYSIQWPGFGNQINDSLWFEVFLPCTVNARLTDQNGCQVEDSAIAQLFVITENDFELQVNDDRVCVNDSVVMDYTYIGTMPMLTVNWVNCLECSFPRTAWIKSDSIFTAELISFCLDTIRKSIPVDMIEIPDMRFDLSGGEICPNEAFLLQADSISAGDWNFTWDFGNGIISNSAQNTVGYAEPGIYFVNLTIQHAEGCVYETDGMDSILVHTSPIANFDTDKTEKSFIDPVFDFTNLSQDAVQFDWNFGDGATSNLENPSHEYEWHGNYLVQLIAINSIGCPDTIVKPILITPDHIIWVPNAFTPDGSNFNESFGIKGHGISDEGFLLRIFDRWGEIIFETADLEDNWDGTYMGKISPDGVYTYQVTYRDLNHKSYLKLGHVTLLR